MRTRSELFFYSPFSKDLQENSQNQALFLQFFLSDLIAFLKQTRSSSTSKNSPFYWCEKPSSLEKLIEHSVLIQNLFPKHAQEARAIEADFQKIAFPLSTTSAQKIFYNLFPLINACKQNATLLFFLLKEQKELGRVLKSGGMKEFLNELFPEGISFLEEKVSKYYTQKGFTKVASQVRKFVQKL